MSDTPDNETRRIEGITEQVVRLTMRLDKLERGLNDLQQWGSGAQVQISSLERKVDEGLSAVNQRLETLEQGLVARGHYSLPAEPAPDKDFDRGRSIDDATTEEWDRARAVLRSKDQQAILEKLAEVWERHPSLRLGQLIVNVIGDQASPRIYYYGDKVLLEALERYPEQD